MPQRQAANSATLKLRLLTRATMASAYVILSFLVYALNLYDTAGLCGRRSGRIACPHDPLVFDWLVGNPGHRMTGEDV
jgi:hypothetical protein